MSQEDVKQLAGLLSQGMNADKQIRENSETIMLNSAEKNPSEMVRLLIEVLKINGAPQDIKKAACIWLKKCCSTFHCPIPKLYAKINSSVQESMKKEIFIILFNEQDEEVCRQIAITIGEIGGALLTDKELAIAMNWTNEVLWPDLVNNTIELYSMKEAKHLASALNIFKILFLYISDRLKDKVSQISDLIQASLEVSNVQIQTLGIQTLASLITTMDAKSVKMFFKFTIPVLKITYSMFFGDNANLDLGSDILTTISEVVETEPKFFRDRFNDFIDLMTQIHLGKDIELSIKEQALEAVISMTQRYPEILLENKSILGKVVEIIFVHFLNIPDQDSDEWMNPPDGFNEKTMLDESQSVVTTCTGWIDRILTSCNDQDSTALSFLSDWIGKLIGTGEWKKIFSSIMALSQVGEYMNDLEELSPIMLTLQKHASHPQPRVRYAICHCIGQISEDLAPSFQEKYHELVFPIMLQMLTDPVPRVVGHWCGSMTNFLENCITEHIQPHEEELFKKLNGLVDTGSSYVKTHALSALSAMAVGSPELFEKYYDNTMQWLLKILEEVNDSKFKILRGNAIECASIISQQCGIEKFNPYAERFIKVVVDIQTHYVSDKQDPQTNFILLAWPRISEIYKENFAQYAGIVMPSLLKICKNICDKRPDVDDLKVDVEPEDDENGDGNNINTYFDEESKNSLYAIQCLLKDCGSSLAPFIEQIYEIVVPLLNYLSNETVRESAAKILSDIIMCLKNSPQYADKLPVIAKDLTSKLWETMDQETEPEMLIKQSDAMKDLIENSGDFMSELELDQMFEKCSEHLKKSEERKLNTDNAIDEEEDEVAVLEVYAQDKDLENEYHCQVAEIFGKIFKTHKEKSLKLHRKIHNLLIVNSLQSNQIPMLKKFGLFLIWDAIDFLGPYLDENTFEAYYNYCKQYSSDPIQYVRHAAEYGLGSLAVALKEKFGPWVDEAFECARVAYKVPQGMEDEKVYKATREMTPAVMGKIIKNTWNLHSEEKLITMLKEWLYLLPIRKDKEEAIPQHEMLVDILENKKNLFFYDIANLDKVIKVIAAIWKTKVSNSALDTRMSNVVKIWSEDEVMREALGKIQLNENQQLWIKKVVSAATI